MDQKMDLPNGMSMRDVMKMANSPAGQQLIRLLQEKKDTNYQSAMSSAAAGNYEEAKKALSSLMESPEVTALLKQLGGMP